MTHKFEFINKFKLDNEWRRENLPAGVTILKLGLSPEDVVADIFYGVLFLKA